MRRTPTHGQRGIEMTHSQHSAPNALLRQVQTERRAVAEAWQFGFFAGVFVAGTASVVLVVPLVLWIVKGWPW